MLKPCLPGSAAAVLNSEVKVYFVLHILSPSVSCLKLLRASSALSRNLIHTFYKYCMAEIVVVEYCNSQSKIWRVSNPE
jgi:hypothetical protein